MAESAGENGEGWSAEVTPVLRLPVGGVPIRAVVTGDPSRVQRLEEQRREEGRSVRMICHKREYYGIVIEHEVDGNAVEVMVCSHGVGAGGTSGLR